MPRKSHTLISMVTALFSLCLVCSTPFQAAATSVNPATPQPSSKKSPGSNSGTSPFSPNVVNPSTPAPVGPVESGGGHTPSPYAPWPVGKFRAHVIDGRTLQPLATAEVVIIETEQRLRTDADGYTPWVDVPVLRNPRYRPLVQELHGQLGAIAYKNGYRDSIHLGIRMHEGYHTETTIWMYRIGPGDVRIEPVLYEVPYHHLWLVELADRFRSKDQPGEGAERP